MQTSFTLAQLADPDVAVSEKILRACVHCGFCTATCPTYVLDGKRARFGRAAASTSSRICWAMIGRRPRTSSCISIAACRASLA